MPVCQGNGKSLEPVVEQNPADYAPKPQFKVLLVGAAGVGKTAVFQRFIYNQVPHYFLLMYY